MRLIDADALPRHGQRGGLVHWKDIENAPTIDTAEGCRGCKHWIYRSNFGEDCEFDDLENCKYEPKDGRREYEDRR